MGLMDAYGFILFTKHFSLLMLRMIKTDIKKNFLNSFPVVIDFKEVNPYTAHQEWLETDGQGGFATAPINLIPNRKYSSFLTVSTNPPTNRFNLVNAVIAVITYQSQKYFLTSLRFDNSTDEGILGPNGTLYLDRFTSFPFPQWRYRITTTSAEVIELEFEFLLSSKTILSILSWKLLTKHAAPIELSVQPLLSVRDYHTLHYKNESFFFLEEIVGRKITWDPYPTTPSVTAYTNGVYHSQHSWYERVYYPEEKQRGYTSVEDLAQPGTFSYTLTPDNPALLCFTSEEVLTNPLPLTENTLEKDLVTLKDEEKNRRLECENPLYFAASQYIVTRDEGNTIIAGYPWFTDWGRDTFIALRGLTLTTKQFDVAKAVLKVWSKTLSDGMIPNLFPDHGDSPLYNSVDASLWFIIAAYEYIHLNSALDNNERNNLIACIETIISSYTHGTRFRIKSDYDGLLTAGIKGTQLTWMDACYGDTPVTPRVGKPVEIQSLWLNALKCAAAFNCKWNQYFEIALINFQEKFWNSQYNRLNDVVDSDNRRGTYDATMRPNQILAIGGLPFMLFDLERAKMIVDAVEKELVTPSGIRSLSPFDPNYRGIYAGSVNERDMSYHQGTAWTWLMGPFIEAWIRVRKNSLEAKQEAINRFIEPLMKNLTDFGINHLSEISDGDAPFLARGAPFQAWSVGEIIRIVHTLETLDKA
jgi:predicted glycogen debranching enzyme